MENKKRFKIAAWIVKNRKWILLLLVVLSGVCVTTIGKTRINYDLTKYLDRNTMTRRAMTVMEEEFGANEQLRVMFRDLDEEELQDRIQRMNDLPQVQIAVHNSAEDVRQVKGVAYQLVTLTLHNCDATALVEELRAMFPGEYDVGGSAAAQLDVQESVAQEIPLVMAISVAVVLLVLLLTSHAWLEPVVLLIVLALSILINMGTNFIFPDISFITFAVVAILQLALSIDYAIMLLHAYNAHIDAGQAAEEAMTGALAESFMPIASSAFTTVAGLLSLLFMSFTIGFDIGLVLSKGIIISMLGVFLMMPAVTLLFGKALQRTRHKPLPLGGERLAKGVHAVRRPLALGLVLIVLVAFWLQSSNTYLFTDPTQSSGDERTENGRINNVFGAVNPLVVLVPGGEEDADYDMQRQLADRLTALQVDGEPVIQDLSAMVATGAEALKYYTPQDVTNMTGLNSITVSLFFRTQGFGESVRADRLLQAADSFASGNESIRQLQEQLHTAKAAFIGPHYARMLLDLRLSPEDSRMRAAIDGILSATRSIYGDDFYITGVPMSTYDIGNAFEGDLMKVNLITFAAILVIVMLSFRAFSLPVLLVFVIEGAIWITMAISRVLGQPIFFMSYLICVSIQMGATIDYGILLCNHYLTQRRTGLSPSQSLTEALRKALPAILTSGVILITAGYIIGRMCSVYYISAIGLLLSRAAFISVVLILTMLPALLGSCDSIIIRRKTP